MKKDTGTTVVIRYANRKLYNKATAQYVTLGQVFALPAGSFMVLDNVTKNDITDSVLINAIAAHFQANVELFKRVKPMLLEEIQNNKGVTDDVVTSMETDSSFQNN